MANNFEQALPDQDWDDILGISDEFSDEEKLVQKTACEYSSKELFPIAILFCDNELAQVPPIAFTPIAILWSESDEVEPASVSSIAP